MVRGIRRAKELVEKDKRDGTVFGEKIPQATMGLTHNNLALTRDTVQQVSLLSTHFFYNICAFENMYLLRYAFSQ